MKYFYSCFFTLFLVLTYAQEFDSTYVSNIRSVRLHLAGFPLSYPVLDLNGSGVLEFSFDDLDADTKTYTYTIVHCNADWLPSKLTSFEYIDGFTEDRIRDNEPAFNTTIPYMHYWIGLPNENMRLTKSGNYILYVYDEEDEKKLVITKRFVISEPLVTVTPKFTFPADVGKTRTHQEIDFTVNYKGLQIASAQQEIRASILQNGHWQSAIKGLAPLFFRGEEVTFDYQDKIVFPAGKEFRYCDLRSLRTRMDGVEALEDYDGDYHVRLYTELDRSDKAYLSREDIDGNYVVETLDADDPRLESDYVDVTFTLKTSSPLPDGDEVYIFGGLSDWQLLDRCKMTYDEATGLYRGRQLLKQGFYNYFYAVHHKGDPRPDTSALEGDWFEAENSYMVFVYYRPFGARYDRVIAAHTFKSVR